MAELWDDSDSIVVDTINKVGEYLSRREPDGDALDSTQIAIEQRRVERLLQGMPAVEYWIKGVVDDATEAFQIVLDEAGRNGVIPAKEGSRSLTVEERRSRGIAVDEGVRDANRELKSAVRRAEKVAQWSKVLDKTLMSLQSRAKNAATSGTAHTRYGEG